MNDELIRQLKYYGNTYAIGDSLGREIQGTDELMLNAADALESMQRQLNQCNAKNAEQAKIIDDLQGKTINWLSDRVDELAIECGKKDTEIAQLKAELDAAVSQIPRGKKDTEIAQLKAENEHIRQNSVSHEVYVAMQKERDAAVEDLYTACRETPCNTGMCAKKGCRGNIIPCEFEWRGLQGRSE